MAQQSVPTSAVISLPAGTTRIVSGALPQGVELGANGRLVGVPTVVGRTVVVLETCTTDGSCVTTTATVNVRTLVLTAPEQDLALTGGDTMPMAETGVGLAGLGGLLLALGRRRRRGEQAPKGPSASN